MRVADFDYVLPPERIAQSPCAERDGARLLMHSVARAATRHEHVRDLPELLRPGDLLVLNDTRVLAARLFGRRASGGRVEVLFVEPAAEGVWRVFANPARRLKAGEALAVAGTPLTIRMIEREREGDGAAAMTWLARLTSRRAPGETVETLLERHGTMPLPPYVKRPASRAEEARDLDRERYQTVYAAHAGAVAAPTAGLHLTAELLERLAAAGVERTTLTLHVGPGTFRPVEVDQVEDHAMHAERYELPPQAVEAVAAARARGGRVVAVGTTSVRVLEAVAAENGRLVPSRGTTDIFLRPGSRFRVVDALLTNFHLPRSTLLMLVSAFAGRERVLGLYDEAIRAGYRFYSYGDAMLLDDPPREAGGEPSGAEQRP